MKKLIPTLAFSFLFVCFAPVAKAATYDWQFTSQSSLSASGQLTVNSSDQVTALSGNVGGQPITFYSNPNFPGTATYAGVPNTGGADYIYDDFFNPTTNTANGILISVGVGTGQVFYYLSDDKGPPTNADLFSILRDGNYVFNEGSLTSSAVSATPLPASWTMFLAALLCLGLVSYRAVKASSKTATSDRPGR